MKRWTPEIIVALAAIVSLTLFFYPKQPERLVSIEGYEVDAVHESKEIFPTLGILFGLSYRCLHLYGKTATFLTDFALPPGYYPGDKLRLWLSPKDYQRLLDNPDIEVRVRAVDIQDQYTQQWTHYVARHPHGHGAFLAVGGILTVLFLVMMVNKICFTGSASTGRT